MLKLLISFTFEYKFIHGLHMYTAWLDLTYIFSVKGEEGKGKERAMNYSCLFHGADQRSSFFSQSIINSEKRLSKKIWKDFFFCCCCLFVIRNFVSHSRQPMCFNFFWIPDFFLFIFQSSKRLFISLFFLLYFWSI